MGSDRNGFAWTIRADMDALPGRRWRRLRSILGRRFVSGGWHRVLVCGKGAWAKCGEGISRRGAEGQREKQAGGRDSRAGVWVRDRHRAVWLRG